MAASNGIMRWETLRSDTFTTIANAYAANTYAPIGGPIEYPSLIIKIVNTTDVTMLVSLAGVYTAPQTAASVAIDVVSPGGFVLYDITTNRTSVSGTLAAPVGEQFYVYGNPTYGDVYVVAIYSSNS